MLPGHAQRVFRAYACLVFVFPGQTPVSRAKPVAPARSRSATVKPATITTHVFPLHIPEKPSSTEEAVQRRSGADPTSTP
jgi:hypothetical protein